jgi:hypothetical protein
VYKNDFHAGNEAHVLCIVRAEECSRVVSAPESLAEAGEMPKTKNGIERPTYEEAVACFRDNGFDVLEAPATANRVFLKKYNVSAAVEADPDGFVKLFAHPGYLIGGEISKLIDKGYQKFLKTTKTEIPATADHLRALHDFNQELRSCTGIPNLYNEALGSVSDAYVYDRVVGRDEPAGARPKRPWERAGKPASKRSVS